MHTRPYRWVGVPDQLIYSPGHLTPIFIDGLPMKFELVYNPLTEVRTENYLEGFQLEAAGMLSFCN